MLQTQMNQITFQASSLPKNQKDKRKQTIDPTVIDENLILTSVKDYNVDNKIITSDVILLQQLRQLTLSFKNIWKMENLQGLEMLEKLQLDNNLIQEISNIGHLTNLKWLDLSFNAIKEIKGLTTLTKLTDLTLFNNQISVLQGLENCKLLNVFSIGNNQIPSYEIITNYFGVRKDNKETKVINFKFLQVLNVAGNPFTKELEYKNHIINSMPNLRYLDYSFIDEVQRNAIKESDEKFRSDAPTQDDYLKMMQIADEEDKKNKEIEYKAKSARMDLIDKLHLELVQDEELDKVKTIKGVEEEIQKFQEKIKETVDSLQKTVILKNTVKMNQIVAFELAIRQREGESERETKETLKKFEHQKKLAFRAKDYQTQGWRTGLEELRKSSDILKDDLLYIEHIIMGDIESAINDFDQNQLQKTSAIIQADISGDHGFKKINEAIKEFFTKISDLSKVDQEKYQQAVNNQADLSEWDEELQSLYENKETLVGTISNLKDTLGGKALNKEQQIINYIDKDIKALVTEYKLRQYERNRKYIQQIHNQVQEYKKLIDELLAASDEDSDG